LYNILTVKLLRLIKMRISETHNKVHVGKHLSDMFPIKNGLKQRDALSPFLFNFAVEYAIRKLRQTRTA
jgi:Reverse transcriptase (RNA-dependent DNA polymerase).